MGSRIWIILFVLTGVSSSYESKVITTSFGKTATLPCQIANLDSDLQFLYWRKDGTTIYSRTSFGEHTGKYSVTDTASLVIPDVMESDAGNYSCIVVRQSLVTKESDIMQLYVIDVSVSHCKDTGQEVDGCSCSINGSNITSLGCSASGFPHPPSVTWEEDRIIYQFSSVHLTRFNENITLTCKARDENLKGVVANKTVCVYYAREVPSTSGSPVETNTTYLYNQARVAAIVVSIVLILVLLTLLILISSAAAYRRKKGKASHFQTSIMATSVPKTIEEPYRLPLSGMNSSGYNSDCVDVLKDSWKNSKGSSLEDLPTSQRRITFIESTISEVDFSTKDCNRDFNATLQRSVRTGDLGDHDAAVGLDMIFDKRDKDECEILITKPDFQEVTDESQIPPYQRNRVIYQSSDADPVVQTRQEENEIPDTPSTEKLLGDKIPK